MSWSQDDKQRFADGDVLKASTMPGKRPTGPSADEWGDDWELETDTPIVPQGEACDLENPEACEVCN